MVSGRTFSGFSLGVSALVEKDGRILLVRRMYEPNKGRWTFPSGYVAPQEPPEAAASRELLEETGVRARAENIIGIRNRISPADNNLLIIFRMGQPQGEPQPDGTEVDAVQFFTPVEIAAADDVIQITKLVVSRLGAGKECNLAPVECAPTPLIQSSYFKLYIPAGDSTHK